MSDAVLITAAGTSQRMQIGKKEYLPFSSSDSEQSVLSEVVFRFAQSKLFSVILITVPSGDEEKAEQMVKKDLRVVPFFENKALKIIFAEGGATRKESVFKGLQALTAENPDFVFVHDGARPWISQALLKTIVEKTHELGAVVPAIPVIDTQKEIDETGKIIKHLERKTIKAVQTPQGFPFLKLLAAHASAAGDDKAYTDDSEIYALFAGDVYICEGERENKKVTFPEDLGY
ncbi:2-C-methyl-D-erythritol 4-phosphate cytidylyltransferase [Treponema phagedenis]|uniref:2-C-methyl-D-erythritol 4-phosphate cytidylyltransferase n=1 Tax=Treponema phagedenis TaxID=162 RepID=A0A0B7GS23_TREPH|nr:IspD/TarI family cytidylyltransferase [Treponema phagedenis]EFW36591.1 putative 2-C-methyl-D-erythritol 4-phosphate cytidylyltransferase [Treponema phagedenis F0421]NVP23573.1 2-C-methyl-D-erythritol 4-phosphate cytidylyltransferase [Treponema phagedenis]QEJ94546.1 2-C-methyl-D-erythritol 4-phosphate cytidylyltransferase [Treponema phagedenis]QEJ98707.1 2-C-methyl-D-erythritol 4-phosphate cytidylyltransferase [Treponema phagedenis]QEK01576.1 2-C-methyl-D-erythritol 4-phosphate cytidylyltran